MTAVVRVPASSANLGSGFDALGLALTMWATFGRCDADQQLPERARVVDEFHPAQVAFRRAGGVGSIWVRSSIPNGRGLGFSGTMRVGGAALALLDDDPQPTEAALAAVLEVAAELEGHADNVAASVHGGVVVAAGGRVARVPVALDPAVLIWVPAAATASTDASRRALPASVPLAVAVDAIGRASLLVAALASGDVSALADAVDDQLHQPARLAGLPGSARALAASCEAGVWCAWLSGSGPSVAALCDASDAAKVADRWRASMAVEEAGAVHELGISRTGVEVLRPLEAG